MMRDNSQQRCSWSFRMIFAHIPIQWFLYWWVFQGIFGQTLSTGYIPPFSILNPGYATKWMPHELSMKIRIKPKRIEPKPNIEYIDTVRLNRSRNLGSTKIRQDSSALWWRYARNHHQAMIPLQPGRSWIWRNWFRFRTNRSRNLGLTEISAE